MAVRLSGSTEISGMPKGVVLESDETLTLDEKIARLEAQKQFETDFSQKFTVSIVEKGKPCTYECHFVRKTGSSPFLLVNGVNRPVIEMVNVANGKASNHATMKGLEQDEALQILTHLVKMKYPFLVKTLVETKTDKP